MIFSLFKYLTALLELSDVEQMSVREKRRLIGFVKLDKWFVTEDHDNDSKQDV